MASSSNRDKRTSTDQDFSEDMGGLICEFIVSLIKRAKLKQSEKISSLIESLGKYMEELARTPDGRQILLGMKKLASEIKDKRKFFAILWRMFHVSGRICSKGDGKLGLFFMGTALLVFLLSTVTGLAEGVLITWFTLAARTFAAQLFASGSDMMKKSAKETVLDKKAFANLLNTISCGSGQEREQVSPEQIGQLERRFQNSTVCPEHGWILL